MRPSRQIHHYFRLAIFNFFVLIVLLFAGQTVLLAQELVKFVLEEGNIATWNLTLENKCWDKPHYFRIKNKADEYLRFQEPTDKVLVNTLSTRRMVGTVNTSGLKIKSYREKVVVECIDCKEPCKENKRVFSIEVTVKERLNVVALTKGKTDTNPNTNSNTDTNTNSNNNTNTNPDTNTNSDTDTDSDTNTDSKDNTRSNGDSNTDSNTDTNSDTDSNSNPDNDDNSNTDSNSNPDTDSPNETPNETPNELPPLTTSPAETPGETPTPPIEKFSENAPPPEAGKVDYFSYLPMTSAIISALMLVTFASTITSKKLFDKWKYGSNALNNLGALKKAIRVKEELAQKWMRKRKNQNLHAIGVGKIEGTNNYCIQLFVENANGEMPDNPPVHLLPKKFQKFPFVIYEMPRAEFLSHNGEDYGDKSREPHDTIIGGISGANTNLANEYGTIGYFCAPTILKPIRKFRKEVYLLSNSHVFANLSKTEKCVGDLIQQPSPGENKKHNFIASLENYVPILFDNDTENPNYIDAAIAKMFQGKPHELKIPVIGKINGYLPKEKIEIRKACHKSGRTTGYTKGEVFSIHLSIWIRYAATGQESFFKEQFLIVPSETSSDFVKGGDSGALVADYENKAIGLVFAGANSNTKFDLGNLPDIDAESLLAKISTKKIRSFGVANPISEVLKGLNVKLML